MQKCCSHNNCLDYVFKKIKSCISIVDKLNYRSVTTQKLGGARTHTHLSTRLHLCRNSTCVPSYRNCIESVFISKEVRKQICFWLSIPGLDGICVWVSVRVCVCVCVCVRGGIKALWDWKVRRCLHTEKKMCLVKPVVWKTYWPEFLFQEYV